MIANRRKREKKSSVFLLFFFLFFNFFFVFVSCAFFFVFWSNFVSKRRETPKWKVCASFCICDYCIVLQAFGRVMMTMMTMMCVKFHPRIANQVGEDRYCRGGIVNIRGGRSCSRLGRPESPKALWRFRVSTSNSPSGLSRPLKYTQLRYIYQTCAQQDIRVYEDDHLTPPKRQSKNPKAL